MIRGTTAQFKFKLPYAKDECEWITIKFWQSHNTSRLLPITRTKDDCDAPSDSKEIYVSLTAEETARFLDKYKAKVQLRAQANGTVFGSKPQLVTVYPMPDDIIGEDPTMPPANEEGWIILDGEIVSD
jgi:hypothetical protein